MIALVEAKKREAQGRADEENGGTPYEAAKLTVWRVRSSVVRASDS